MDASGDSSLLIYARCHGFEDNRKHKADFISDVAEPRIQNPASVLSPPPPTPVAASCLYVCRYCPRLEEVMPHELSATSALKARDNHTVCSEGTDSAKWLFFQ